MPSFDIVCQLDKHEVTNAVDQANREVSTRFDFKGIQATYQYEGSTITLHAETDFQLRQMIDILEHKFGKRQIDLEHMKIADPVIQHKNAQQVVTLQEGISQELAKKIVKFIKAQKVKVKVQAAVQGEQVRVSGKKRDDLQEVIGLLEAEEFGLPLQFGNFRD